MTQNQKEQYKYFGDNNRRCSRKKEYETYQINKVRVNVFKNQRNNWMQENTEKGKKVNQAKPLLRIRHDSQRHLQNLKI
ncbi:Protein CBG04956 [Caenorhabditis briggsae]|uniref:Protein CBG04956 n=1 Tax=Caenorhabditis briggsae TaxID=6238 RepID=A8WYW2_CAEBR|nr:Protein CBG04956 [Caenorhabditis briggsae]CAP25570.1 Protein CBG04956 [Caenorhabditis briggsae]